MAYRVLIRGGIGRKGGDSYKTAIKTTERMLREQYKEIWKNHLEELEAVAELIEEDALLLVPKDTGKLADSIHVYVTKSRRYPGIIAHAYANSGGKPGPGGYIEFDYAYIQEITEESPTAESDRSYSHEDPNESAHYLGGPFVIHIAELYNEITGKKLEVSRKMREAADYVKDKI